MREVSSSCQELSGNAQYALGSLCECGDILTCTAAHTHKSGGIYDIASPETEVEDFDHHIKCTVPMLRYFTTPSFCLCFTTHLTFSADHGGRRLQPIPLPVAR